MHSPRGVSCKKGFLTKFRKINRKTPVPGSLFKKPFFYRTPLAASLFAEIIYLILCFLKPRSSHQSNLRPETLLKRDSDTGISCEFCEIFKNTFFTEHLRTTASESPLFYTIFLLSTENNFKVFYNVCLLGHVLEIKS